LKYIKVIESGELELSTAELPIPGHNECLVKVIAIGVNRADLLQRAGKYPAPKGESDILGLEVSGEIVQCCNNKSTWKNGDRVFGLVAGGGYAQYVLVSVDQLFKLPSSFSFEQGAGTAEIFLTAYQSLFSIANLKPNQTVLIHAGASGVGTAAIQLAKAKGCYVVVTVGSEKKREVCLSLGADIALKYKNTDFVSWTKENVATGYDIILDVVGGDYVARNLNVAALDAHIVLLAMLGGRFAENVDIAKMLMKRVTLSASTLRNRSAEYKAQLVVDFKHDFQELLDDGAIKPIIDQVYTWENADAAHHKMSNNLNAGKLILKVV